MARVAKKGWWLEALLCGLGGLMVTMDGTIVNVIVPTVQKSMNLSPGDRQWLVTVLFLTMGTLLLVGGQLADRFGAKRTLIAGVIGFGTASALAGLSATPLMLIACRIMQGCFGALLNPSCLAIVASASPSTAQRARMFAIFGATAASGSPIGMIVGGVVSHYLSWRGCLFVNLCLALPLALIIGRVVQPRAAASDRVRFDIAGAVLVTLALGLVVLGAAQVGPGGAVLLRQAGLIGAGLLLFGLFVLFERRLAHPLVQVALLADRTRLCILIGMMLIAGPFIGVAIQLSFFVQNVLHFSPFLTGFALLPSTLGSILGSAVSGLVVARFGAQRTFIAGGLLCSLGLWLLLQANADSSYWTAVLPGDGLSGLGLGLTMMPATNLFLRDIAKERVGVAGALTNASMQVGAAIAITIVNSLTIAVTPGAGAGAGAGAPGAEVAGFHAGFTFAAISAVLGAMIVVFHVRRDQPGEPGQNARGCAEAPPSPAWKE